MMVGSKASIPQSEKEATALATGEVQSHRTSVTQHQESVGRLGIAKWCQDCCGISELPRMYYGIFRYGKGRIKMFWGGAIVIFVHTDTWLPSYVSKLRC